jgi:predicted phage-related endonuclease
MKAKAVAFASPEEWHALRAGNIGGTEQACLWNASPYTTPFALHHIKRGTMAAPVLDGTRMRAGKFLEPAIAAMIADEHGKAGTPWLGGYLLHAKVKGMGVSLDWTIDEPGIGTVPFEIKNVDRRVFDEEWKLDDGSIEPPLHIDLQVQHQLAVWGGAPFAYVGVLVGGNETKLLQRPRMPEIIADCEARVKAFWRDVKAGNEPEINWRADLSTLSRARLRLNEADMTLDESAADLVRLYAEGARLCAEGDGMKEEAKAKALVMLGANEAARTKAGKISAKLLAATEARSVTYAAQPERREVRIYPHRPKASRPAALAQTAAPQQPEEGTTDNG